MKKQLVQAFVRPASRLEMSEGQQLMQFYSQSHENRVNRVTHALLSTTYLPFCGIFIVRYKQQTCVTCIQTLHTTGSVCSTQYTQLTVLLDGTSSTTPVTPSFTFDRSPFYALQVPQYYYRRSQCLKYLIYSSVEHISQQYNTHRVFHPRRVRHCAPNVLGGFYDPPALNQEVDASRMVNPVVWVVVQLAVERKLRPHGRKKVVRKKRARHRLSNDF